MRLKVGEFLIKVQTNLAWGCFGKNGGLGNFIMKTFYENLMQMPNYFLMLTDIL